MEQLYLKRLQKYLKVDLTSLRPQKHSAKLSSGEIKRMEADQFMAELHESNAVILLDELGDTVDSQAFSHLIQSKMTQSVRKLIFIIGGAYGIGDSLKRRYPRMIRLSSLTFSHHLARVVLLEQLYRAFTILNNEPYHNS